MNPKQSALNAKPVRNENLATCLRCVCAARKSTSQKGNYVKKSSDFKKEREKIGGIACFFPTVLHSVSR